MTGAPPGPPDVRAVLADVARTGPFFVLAVPDPGDRADHVRFVRLADDPAPLADRIARVRDALGTDDRVAASIAFQGMIARLVAAPLAAVVLHAVLPAPSGLARRPDAADPWEPWLLDATGTRVPDPARDPAGAAAALSALLLDDVVSPLLDAVRTLVPVSGRVLWGNVASSLAGAARVLDTARPATRPALPPLLTALLATPPLTRTGDLTRHPGGWTFHRNSCCLYYRIPAGSTCGDCILTRPRN